MSKKSKKVEMTEENAAPIEQTVAATVETPVEPKAPPRKSTFALLVESLREGPKSRKELATTLFANSRKEGYTEEHAFNQVPIRLNHLRKRGYEIKSIDKMYNLLGKKVVEATPEPAA